MISNITTILGLSGANGVGVSKLVANFDSVNANRIILLTVTLLKLISHEVSSKLKKEIKVFSFIQNVSH